MPHETSLIATIAASFLFAFIGGMLAARLRLPPLVGYLAAGMLIGPFTPGFVADIGLARQLAEVGVILLMFGVGLHFSPRDLLAVRGVAIPGALGRVVITTALAVGLTRLWGWSVEAGLIFGLALAVASTVVVLRNLEERDALNSPSGRIMVGWLIIEDIAMVFALVLLPAFAGLEGGNLLGTLLTTVAKLVGFIALMLLVGARVVPWLLERVVRLGSRELFTLSVLALALGVAYGSAAVFGVSFALGAFLAGIVVGESDLSHHAAAEALPLRDAFAVLFFTSVGMLFDPSIITAHPWWLLATLAIILVLKSLATVALVLLARYPLSSALTVSAGLAQIGEFSFILAALGVELGLLPEAGQSLILAGAIISITVNPLILRTVEPILAFVRRHEGIDRVLEPRDVAGSDAANLRGHAVVVGYGRVGQAIGDALGAHGVQYVIVELDRRIVDETRGEGKRVIFGDATLGGVLEEAGIARACLLVVATPDPLQTREVVHLALEVEPSLHILARTHSDSEQEYLRKRGVSEVFMGERELAASMARQALVDCGVPWDDAVRGTRDLRRRAPLERSPRGVTQGG